MRLARLAAVTAVALAVTLAVAFPAHAANTLLHKRSSVATAATPLDSTLWTLTTNASGALAGRDTLVAQGGTIVTDNLSTAGVPDSIAERGALLGAGRAFPKNLWVVVEVTGSLQSIDSLYAFVQYSQGQVPPSTGQTNTFTANSIGDPNSFPFNWRWYDGIGLTASSALTGGLTALVNNTSSQTFIFPIPTAASDVKANWLASSNLRVILVSDTNASAVGLSTRAWLVWR